MRVLAAMSGGVDSAVAAAKAVQAGHDVVGVHLALSGERAANRNGARGCCTIEDADDARRAADVLGIPFYVWDLSARFHEDVIDDFVAEYAAGHTPNPCVRCNEKIKFSALLDKAIALGFDALATGHYAHLEQTDDGPVLSRAAHRAKDQSYVLAVVPPQRLRQALFPLGAMPSKDDVRAEAERLGMTLAAKPDSHDICFIPDGDTRAWLSRRLPTEPGVILDETGEVVGEHDGALGHTVGQRRGLRLGRPAPDGKPRYVLEVSVATNTLTVGTADELRAHTITGRDVCWQGPRPVPGDRLLAQIRSHGRTAEAVVVEADEAGVRVELAEGLTAVSAGQTLVLYDQADRRVVGSATMVVDR